MEQQHAAGSGRHRRRRGMTTTPEAAGKDNDTCRRHEAGPVRAAGRGAGDREILTNGQGNSPPPAADTHLGRFGEAARPRVPDGHDVEELHLLGRDALVSQPGTAPNG